MSPGPSATPWAVPPNPCHPGWTTYSRTNNVTDLAFDGEGALWAAGSGGAVWVGAL